MFTHVFAVTPWLFAAMHKSISDYINKNKQNPYSSTKYKEVLRRDKSVYKMFILVVYVLQLDQAVMRIICNF